MEQIAPSVDLNTIKQKYQCPMLLGKRVSAVCVHHSWSIYNICLFIYHLPHFRLTVQWLMCVPNLFVFWFIFSCATVPDFFLQSISHFWCECLGVVPRLFPALPLWLARLPLSVERKWLPPWGKLCCPSVLSSALCLQQWSKLQNIASRLQGRLHMAFLILLMC